MPNILTQKVMLQEGFVLLGQVNLQPSDKQLLASYNNILACLGLRALHVFLIHRTFGTFGQSLCKEEIGLEEKYLSSLQVSLLALESTTCTNWAYVLNKSQ